MPVSVKAFCAASHLNQCPVALSTYGILVTAVSALAPALSTSSTQFLYAGGGSVVPAALSDGSVTVRHVLLLATAPSTV